MTQYNGTIEGFYGQPWSGSQRKQLFAWMREWGGMNAYLYAPKDDLKHRNRWRDLYLPEELEKLQSLIRVAHSHEIQFIYAISPGLDIQYSDVKDQKLLFRKLDQLVKIGVRQFAVLLDDIPPNLSDMDKSHFQTFAAAQSYLVNEVQHYLHQQSIENELLFCPTIYCGRMANYEVKESEYLQEIGEKLNAKVVIFWTGPEVISPEISIESIIELQSVIRRKPLIWDNLHANDYDLHRVFVGPYSGRPPELQKETVGIMSNPNCEFWANYIPLKSLALFLQSESNEWNPREVYLQLIPEWTHYFGEHRFSQDEIVFFGDCFYLPFQLGEKSVEFLRIISDTCAEQCKLMPEALEKFFLLIHTINKKISEISNRDLFYALHPFFWELSRVSKMHSAIKSKHLDDMILMNYLPHTAKGSFTGSVLKEFLKLFT